MKGFGTYFNQYFLKSATKNKRISRGDMLVYVFIRISSKPDDDIHKYGYGKYETLATALIGVALFVVGFKLFWDGGSRVFIYLFRGEQLQQPGCSRLASPQYHNHH